MVRAYWTNPRGSYLHRALLGSDMMGTSRNSISHMMPVSEQSEGCFIFHRPIAPPHPQQTWNTAKARNHNYDVPQRQITALLVSQVPAISAGLTDSSIQVQFPVEMCVLLHTEEDSSFCYPWQCKLTPTSTRNTGKSSSARLQQQVEIWTWPPSFPNQSKWKNLRVVCR